MPPIPAPYASTTAAAPSQWLIESDLDTLPRIPTVTLALIGVLGLVYLAELAFGFEPGASQSLRSLIALGGESRDLTVGQGEVWRLLTAVLLHASVQHLFGNCIVLLVAGVVLEQRLGSAWFAAIFLLGGVASSVASLVYGSPHIVSVGASGAIMAVLVATLVETFANETIYTSKNLRAWVMLTSVG